MLVIPAFQALLLILFVTRGDALRAYPWLLYSAPLALGFRLLRLSGEAHHSPRILSQDAVAAARTAERNEVTSLPLSSSGASCCSASLIILLFFPISFSMRRSSFADAARSGILSECGLSNPRYTARL